MRKMDQFPPQTSSRVTIRTAKEKHKITGATPANLPIPGLHHSHSRTNDSRRGDSASRPYQESQAEPLPATMVKS